MWEQLQWGLAVGQRDQAQLFMQSGKWEFTDKEQGGASRWEISKKKHQGQGDFWLNQPNRILAKSKPGNQTSPGGCGA